ncbi:transposable element Tcb1 transposase [Trichonephila clavipes]|nr:transposable element Tcb1 transposase [Trichonephila clavipes]
MTGHIYQDVILEQHVRLFRGAMGAEFLFMDDNARPRRANIVDECLQSEDITRMDWPAYSPDLNPIEHVTFLGCCCDSSAFLAKCGPPPVKSVEARRLPHGVLWQLGEGGSSSGVVLVTSPFNKMTTFVE